MAPNMLKNIAIVGAGGRVGTYITQALLSTGKHTITAITRAESTSELPQGMLRANVDYSNETSLVEALKGQDCLIITLGRAAAPNAQSQLVQAAAKAGVSYIIPNLWGYDTRDGELFRDFGPFATVFSKIVEEIETLGVSKWIGVANGFWYEFSLGGSSDRFGFDFAKRTATFVDDGNLKINTTTFPQVGRAVAALLSLEVISKDNNEATVSRWDNDILFISSFRISQRDMFESVKRVIGTTDTDWTINHESHRERYDAAVAGMRKGDVSSFVRAMYTRIFFPDLSQVGDFEGSRGTANKALDLPEEDIDEATKIAIERGLAGIL